MTAHNHTVFICARQHEQPCMGCTLCLTHEVHAEFRATQREFCLQLHKISLSGKKARCARPLMYLHFHTSLGQIQGDTGH